MNRARRRLTSVIEQILMSERRIFVSLYYYQRAGDDNLFYALARTTS